MPKNIPKKPDNRDDNRPATPVVVACLVAIVALSLIDALVENFQVDKLVYAIIAGILFGVGGLNDLLGRNKK
ncbi:hypothetical protein HZA56_14045 [Candidatus Poribacteria bacterium]|nr:hypothetical protein [Candidatus Poribacteria bacterium]